MAANQIVHEPLLPPAAIAGSVACSPPVDLREFPDRYIVLTDLPGVEPGAFEVTSHGDTLRIAAVRRDRLRTGGVPVRLERPAGRLHRTMRLPASCDSSKITTQIRDGVLEVRIPKTADSAGRSVVGREASCASR
jgi:HSP20 family protein